MACQDGIINDFRSFFPPVLPKIILFYNENFQMLNA